MAVSVRESSKRLSGRGIGLAIALLGAVLIVVGVLSGKVAYVIGVLGVGLGVMAAWAAMGGRLVYPLLFLNLLLMDITFKQATGGATAPGGVAVLTAIKFAVYGASATLGGLYWHRLRCGRGLLLLGAYVVWAVASVAWAVDHVFAAGAAMILVSNFALGTVVGSGVLGNVEELLRVMFGALLTKVGLSVLGGFVPNSGFVTDVLLGHVYFSGRLGGLCGSPNVLGFNGAVLFVVGMDLYLRAKSRVGRLIAIMGCGVAIIGLGWAQSRTALIVWVVGTLLYLAFRLPKYWVPISGAIVTLVSYAVYENVLSPDRILRRAVNPNDVRTLAGRTLIWKIVGSFIGERPVAGHGYGAAYSLLPSAIAGENKIVITSAHNMFLECLLSLGGVGLILLAMALIIVVWGLFRLVRRHEEVGIGAIGIAIVAMCLLLGITESGIAGVQRVPTLLLFVLGGLALCTRTQGAHREGEP